jgi:hypothetical protein
MMIRPDGSLNEAKWLSVMTGYKLGKSCAMKIARWMSEVIVQDAEDVRFISRLNELRTGLQMQVSYTHDGELYRFTNEFREDFRDG